MARIPKVKLRAIPVFPSVVTAQSPILLERDGVTFAFSIDMNAVADSLSTVFQPINAGSNQEITAGATAVVDQDAATVRVNKTVGGATTLTVPDSHLKTCDVLIVDWKADAGTNPITINLSGTDTFQGGLTTWTIAADGGSILLRRIPGVGYLL